MSQSKLNKYRLAAIASAKCTTTGKQFMSVFLKIAREEVPTTSFASLSKFLGYKSRSYISDILHGRKPFSLGVAIRLKNNFNLPEDISDILMGFAAQKRRPYSELDLNSDFNQLSLEAKLS